MLKLDFHPSGRHFLQIPGPSPVPDRILRAMSLPTIDHRGPEFAVLAFKVIADMQKIFQTQHPVMIYPASLEGWRHGIQADLIETRLKADTNHTIKAVCVVHNETSTGVTSDIPAVRRAIDNAKHPALLLVDTVSGLAAIDYRHDAWGVDVTVGGSQKGLMLPPGLGFNALSPKAIEVSKKSTVPKSFWAWDEMIEFNKTGYFPSTPNTNLLYGLSEACDMILGQGLDVVFKRHKRWSAGACAAVTAWGLPIQCADPALHSPILTGVMTPEGVRRRHSESYLRTL